MVPAPLRHTRPVEAIAIGGSAGSIAALEEILPGLPVDFPPVLIALHLPAHHRSRLPEIFAPRCAMRVLEADLFEPIVRGSIYFAPADYHLLVEPSRRCALSIEPPVHFSRPAIDALFESAADVYRSGLVGVVLTGANHDGAMGLRAIERAGGLAMVQSPETATVDIMPHAALAAVPRAHVVGLDTMLAALRSVAQAS